jgi:hypothetical protein
VLYVEQLIAADVINTMPESTLHAFADHGVVGDALNADARDAGALLRLAGEAGIDLGALTAELEHEGLRAFCDSYHQLLACIQEKLDHARHATPVRPSTDVTVEDHTPLPVFAEGVDRAVDRDGVRHAARGR